MSDRPIILFPSPEEATRAKRKMKVIQPQFPNKKRQYERLIPKFAVLKKSFENRSIELQDSVAGIEPEFALVFEIIGSVDNFYNAVKRVQGMEWVFESHESDIEADEDFYKVDSQGNKEEGTLSGKVYCVMTNKEALNQLLSLWERYVDGEDVFPYGFGGLKDIFTHIKDIRSWNAQDRIEETHVMDYWKEELEFTGSNVVPFEIELFFRRDSSKRRKASEYIEYVVKQLGGKVLQNCVIEGIQYHSLLVSLPKKVISNLVNNYEDIQLVKIDDVMFFRPVSQAMETTYTDTCRYDLEGNVEEKIGENPILALFDGMPIQNHKLLKNRLLVDDPDEYEKGYLEKYRCHGTAMASLMIYGDLNTNHEIHKRKIYVRPVFKPYEDFWGDADEKVPDDVIFVDVIHRAVKRIFEGENGEPPVSPDIKVINMSIGDPVRQLTSIMSPLARLLDWLSFKYQVLFVVSAGIHNRNWLDLDVKFDDFRKLSLNERETLVFNYIKENNRNLRVLSPAESINALTVGALYQDESEFTENRLQILAVEEGLPSPISSYGLGYNNMIKPDIFYFGGKKPIIRNSKNDGLRWAFSGRAPGVKVAAPYNDGTESGCAYSFGTSDAAAQITYQAGRCYDVLMETFLNETHEAIPNEYVAILLKGMLVHGATWEPCGKKIADLFGESEKRLKKWMGNGIPDVDRVIEGTDKRITLIGVGKLQQEKAHVYSLPLPFEFGTKMIKRRLTVTVAYFAPTVPGKQKYRSSQIWFELEQTHNLFTSRQNTDWNSVKKGTVQHEIFVDNSIVVWDKKDDIRIKVNCKKDAENNREKIPYCIFVTFEAIEGLGTETDVYETVATRIKQREKVAP